MFCLILFFLFFGLGILQAQLQPENVINDVDDKREDEAENYYFGMIFPFINLTRFTAI